ncbi:MAG: hypothetical protein C0398_05290 [Coprothermobacter sp.]|nr:hypothetical protein [Coprothermobacter sp.]
METKKVFASRMKRILASDVLDAGLVAVRTQVQLNGHVAFTPTVVDGRAFCSVIRRRLCEHTVVAVDLKSGSIQWQVSIGKWSHVDPISPLAQKGLLYIGTDDGNVVCLRQDTGESTWLRHVCREEGTAAHCAMALTDSLVLVGTYEGDIVALDLTTGELRWRRACSDESGTIVSSSPVVWQDNVVFSNWFDEVHCLDVLTGEEQWSLELIGTGGRHHMDPLLVGDELIMPGSVGGIYCLNLATRESRVVAESTRVVRAYTPVLLGDILYWRSNARPSLNGVSCQSSKRHFSLTMGSARPYEISIHKDHLYCPSGPWLYVVEPHPATGIPTEYRIRKYKSPHHFVTGLAHDASIFCAGIATDKLLIGRLPDASPPDESHSR